jgi:hypothetical protein
VASASPRMALQRTIEGSTAASSLGPMREVRQASRVAQDAQGDRFRPFEACIAPW